MNTLKHITILMLVAFLSFSCKNEANPKAEGAEAGTASQNQKNLDPNATYAKAEFTIEGMTCAMGCAKTIEKNIAGMEGVKSATVDFDRKLAMVEYDEAKITPTSLTEAVTKTGDMYKVSDMKTVDDFSPNKTCAGKCDPNCTKKDCPNCKMKSATCKTNCANKTEAQKMACMGESQKSCCMNKTKV